VDPGRIARVEDPFGRAAELLAARSALALPYPPTFHPLTAQDPGMTRAVDGSSAVLVDTGAVWVVAYRAHAVTWPGPPSLPSEVEVRAFLSSEASTELETHYTSLGLEPPGRVASAEQAAELLRGAAESRVASQAIRAAQPDELLLLDGALERLPSHAAALVDPLIEQAEARGVVLLGISKRSALEAGGVPLLPRLHRDGQATGGPWYSPLPGHARAHACLLHPRAPHAYRVDGDASALGRLVELARDAVYLGYPYPLAVAHNAVAITASTKERLRHRLEDGVRLRGGAAAQLLLDPHAMLDRNVP
jgi:hypothetical protein